MSTHPQSGEDRKLGDGASITKTSQHDRQHTLATHGFVTHLGAIRAEIGRLLTEVTKGEENGLHACAVVSSEGLVLVEDSANKWKVSNRRDAFDVVESFLLAFLNDY